MRKQARLEQLNEEDQQHVLKTCEQGSYAAAVEILAQPRDQGGLDLKTNRASLCRFVQKHDDTEALNQKIEATLKRLQDQHPRDALDYSNAVARFMQERIFGAMVNGSEFDDIRREFTAYLALKRTNLAESKCIPPKPNPAAWLEHNDYHHAVAAQYTKSSESLRQKTPVITEIPPIPQPASSNEKKNGDSTTNDSPKEAVLSSAHARCSVSAPLERLSTEEKQSMLPESDHRESPRTLPNL